MSVVNTREICDRRPYLSETKICTTSVLHLVPSQHNAKAQDKERQRAANTRRKANEQTPPRTKEEPNARKGEQREHESEHPNDATKKKETELQENTSRRNHLQWHQGNQRVENITSHKLGKKIAGVLLAVHFTQMQFVIAQQITDEVVLNLDMPHSLRRAT